MDLSHYHIITNNYQDVRLLSLKSWKAAPDSLPCDAGGPYVVSQQGFDASVLRPTPDEFLLGKSGAWISLGLFYRLPKEMRLSEFIFGTAAEVVELMDELPSEPRMFGHDLVDNTDSSDQDDLAQAVAEARNPKS